jgi:hypothetical protein
MEAVQDAGTVGSTLEIEMQFLGAKPKESLDFGGQLLRLQVTGLQDAHGPQAL